MVACNPTQREYKQQENSYTQDNGQRYTVNTLFMIRGAEYSQRKENKSQRNSHHRQPFTSSQMVIKAFSLELSLCRQYVGGILALILRRFLKHLFQGCIVTLDYQFLTIAQLFANKDILIVRRIERQIIILAIPADTTSTVHHRKHLDKLTTHKHLHKIELLTCGTHRF